MAKRFFIALITASMVLISVLSGCLFGPGDDLSLSPPPDDGDNNHHRGGGNGGSGGSGNQNGADDENPAYEPIDEGCGCDLNNIVRISPNETTTGVYQPFTITILCEPIQLIKAWEATISFDPLYLQAADVVQGNIFDGYETFPSPDITIDNVNGTITKLYNLILGKDGMVMRNGSLASIQFVSIMPGETNIDITMIGLTNETQYIPVQTYNATVSIK